MSLYRPTWAEISESAFVSNLENLRRHVGERVRLLAVLKADGYGHGATDLAKLAVTSGADAIGVSILEEGIALRQAGVRRPILLLGGIFPLKNFSVALEYDLTPTVASLEAAQALAAEAERRGRRAACHLKVDTGMGRIGVSPGRAADVIGRIAANPHLVLEGVYSHFACADGDAEFTTQQLDTFRQLRTDAVPRDTLFHIANSAGLLHERASHLDMVRPGLALYGLRPSAGPVPVVLRPVLSWRTKIVFLKKVPKGTGVSYGRTFVTARESDIATLPVGYADGVPRAVSNRGAVLVRGKRCAIVGRVTMDHIMIDVTGLGADVGDDVTLIGEQDGVTLTADEWAAWSETISYEIVCGISKRVPRRMVN
jgi:alanine racemase